jgi:two-component system response regulator
MTRFSLASLCVRLLLLVLLAVLPALGLTLYTDLEERQLEKTQAQNTFSQRSVVGDIMADPIEILLVEDNPNDVELTLRVLQQHKLANHIEVVRDGAEALEFIFCTATYAHRSIENGPKVVLLDLKLPKVDGLEVLRQVKSDPRTRAIPIVVLTSSREERDIVESYKLGTNSYIVKPVDFEQFTEAVRQLGLYWLLLNQPPGAI